MRRRKMPYGKDKRKFARTAGATSRRNLTLHRGGTRL